MKLGYVILYVPDVEASIAFYEKAFGLKRRFVHESGYGELETGATALAFAAETLAHSNGVRFHPSRPSDAQSPAAEIAFVLDDPQSAFERAVSAGAAPVKEASQKPWGQIVAYVRDLNGFLVELCTPVGG
jgi:catechol 2,3-dioxygenase-like lactoylglutathione lyase family enzyme